MCFQKKRIFSFVTNICNWHYCLKILCRAYIWQIKSALHFMLCTLSYIVFCIVIYFTAKYLQKASAVKFVPILSESTFQIVLTIVHCTHWNVDYLIYEMVYLECDDEYDEEQNKSDVHCGWFFCLPEKGLIRGLGRRMQIDYQRPIHPKYTLGKYKTHWKPPENHPKPTKKPRPKKVSLRTLEKNTHRLPATYTPKIWT